MVSSAQTFVVFDPIHLVKFISILNTVTMLRKTKKMFDVILGSVL